MVEVAAVLEAEDLYAFVVRDDVVTLNKDVLKTSVAVAAFASDVYVPVLVLAPMSVPVSVFVLVLASGFAATLVSVVPVPASVRVT